MNLRVLTAVVAAMLAAVALAAQAVPNFAGTWVLDLDRTAARSPAPAGGGTGGGRGTMSGGGTARVGGGSAAPPEFVITQTAAALTIVRALPDGQSQKSVYALDGSESVNVNGRTTQKTRSTAAGGKVTTVGTQTVTTTSGDVSSEIREVRSLDKEGAMVVELTRTVSGNSRTTTQVFRKK